MLGNNTLRVRRSVDELKVEPVIVIDTREQAPLAFERLRSVRGTLVTGDYSVLGLESQLSFERKSIADLVACCIGENRERFERELLRLRGYRFRRLVLIGSKEEILSGSYRSSINPKSVWASLCAWECRFDVPVVFSQPRRLRPAKSNPGLIGLRGRLF